MLMVMFIWIFNVLWRARAREDLIGSVEDEVSLGGGLFSSWRGEEEVEGGGGGGGGVRWGFYVRSKRRVKRMEGSRGVNAVKRRATRGGERRRVGFMC